ncbi:hypothetical protein K9M50_03390, partial [Patescibacteria group bacterium]|nr:hypothetical protein [Patescibacteria group bacterium]
IFGALMYKLNISTFKAHSQAIEGYSQIYRGHIHEGLDTFVEALDSKTPMQRDPRSSLIKLILNNPQLIAELEDEKKIEYYNRLLVLNSYNIKSSSNYNVYLLQEAQIFNKMADLYEKMENKDKHILYKEKALQYINSAIKASPERIKQYWMKGQILIDLSYEEQALEKWQKAIDLNKNFAESYCQFAQAYLIVGQKENAWKQMDECISSGGIDNYGQRAVLMEAVKHYQVENDYENMVAVYSRYAKLVDSAEVWQSLAEMYSQKERWQEAKKSAEKAYELVTDQKKKNSIKVFLDIVERKLNE